MCITFQMPLVYLKYVPFLDCLTFDLDCLAVLFLRSCAIKPQKSKVHTSPKIPTKIAIIQPVSENKVKSIVVMYI